MIGFGVLGCVCGFVGLFVLAVLLVHGGASFLGFGDSMPPGSGEYAFYLSLGRKRREAN